MLTNCAVDKVSGQDRLLVVWFGEVKTCIWIFNYMGGLAPLTLHCSKVHCIINFRRLSSVQLLSRVQLFVTAWTAGRQTSLSTTSSQCLFKLKSIESVMPSSHLILCCPLLLLPSTYPSIKVFSTESILHIR